MSNMINFLVNVGTDIQLKSAFQRKPEEVMIEAGLTEEEIHLFNTNDVDEIIEKLGGQELGSNTWVHVVQ